jgi:uncharacterized Zn finger protein
MNRAAMITCEGCNRDLQISHTVTEQQILMLNLLPDTVTCPHCGSVNSTQHAEMREISDREAS